MGVTPLTFTGTSSYSSDFQAILTRAVNIANIPLQQLENQDSTDLSKKTQLGTLNAAVSSLTSAVQALGSLASSGAISATSSNPAAVSVTATGATAAATYTVNSVTTLASAASETSVSGYSDSASTPVSSTGTMNLQFGANNYAINLTSQTNNLVGLQSAINSLNAGVTASILTTGNGNFLSVSADSPGATTLQLFDGAQGAGTTDLLTSANQGTNAVFMLNGLPVTRSENTINDLIAGTTLTLNSMATEPTTITLASDPTQLSSAIQNMVTAYNGVVTQIDGQTGPSAGVLVGDPALLQVESTMQQLVTYQGSGAVQSLADMGIDLNSDGTMSLDQSVFGGLTTAQLTSALQFFGSPTTGFGGLSQDLTDISDPIQGSIANEENSLTSEDANLQTQITNTTASINTMQNNLFTQLSQADTLIATLNSQQSALTASVQSLDYVLYGTQTNSGSSTG